jgi:hypothetical protein
MPVLQAQRTILHPAQILLFHPHHMMSHLTVPPSAPSLLDYARYHGLAKEHLALDLDLSTYFDTTQDELPGSLSCIAPPIALPKEPKLRLNTSELQLLATNLLPPPLRPPQLGEILPDRHRIHRLKLEIPLLLTDHEEDLLCFTKRPSLNLHDLGVLPERIGFPASDFAEHQDVKLSQEKLQASKEDFLYLQHALQAPYTPEVYQQVIEDALPSYTHVSLTCCVKTSQSRCRLTCRSERTSSRGRDRIGGRQLFEGFTNPERASIAKAINIAAHDTPPS